MSNMLCLHRLRWDLSAYEQYDVSTPFALAHQNAESIPFALAHVRLYAICCDYTVYAGTCQLMSIMLCHTVCAGTCQLMSNMLFLHRLRWYMSIYVQYAVSTPFALRHVSLCSIYCVYNVWAKACQLMSHMLCLHRLLWNKSANEH